MKKFTTSVFNDKILSSFVTVLLWTFLKKILSNWMHCNSLNKICVFKSRDFKQDTKVFWWLVKIFWDTEVQTNKQNRFQSRMVIVINRKDIHNIHIVFLLVRLLLFTVSRRLYLLLLLSQLYRQCRKRVTSLHCKNPSMVILHHF